jgi:CRP-like cAMP-binding protein
MEFKHTVEYEDGELILMEGGESDRNIYVLLEGQAKVTKETDKGQVMLALLEEGDIFGEVSFLGQRIGARSATIAARGKVKIGILDHEKLAGEYKNFHHSSNKCLKSWRDASARLLPWRLDLRQGVWRNRVWRGVKQNEIPYRICAFR